MMGSEAILCVLVVHLLLAAGARSFMHAHILCDANFLISFLSLRIVGDSPRLLCALSEFCFFFRIVGDLSPLVSPPVEDSCASKG